MTHISTFTFKQPHWFPLSDRIHFSP